MLTFFKKVVDHFFNSNTFQKGAALAYYAVFSIFPIIIIVISILGIVFGKQAVTGEVFHQLKDILGTEGATQIQNIIKQQHVNHNSIITTIVGFATLILSASGMFSQIHNAFNNIWNIKSKPKNSIIRYFTKHLSSFGLLMLLFFTLIVSTSVNAFLMKHSDRLHSDYRISFLYEHFSSFIVIAILFAIMFKFLGDAKVNWKPAILSGLFTAFLFILGKIGIAIVIGKSHLSTTFGSASILALIMLWVYYLSQIIFLGASFLKVLCDKMKLPILPNQDAVKIVQQEINNS
ncbi:YihY/virulence factor BrkB family protein [Tenacibaculum sp. S7007]|uniref:YihY/virulence factor BrkB family protein n=1 Tax=Tenacibaculum pelagium TaxID=2759527 RepID=A0A839AL85_9FLAO|nr:YihY/virulence factor BrkB family protein [Tenacibaculum pelagium]MBA6155140.1 YihY/virulence factor BrkB family protein [Tenacibaculum pelagium]